MKKHLRILALVLSIITMLCMIGCGGGDDVNYEYDFTISNKKLTYSIYGSLQYFSDKDGDTVLKEIEDKFNVKIKLSNGGEEWRRKLTTLINSNRNVPDLFFIIPDEASFSDLAKKGAIAPLNGYLDKLEEETGSSNLKNLLNTKQFKNTTDLDGTYFFYPQVNNVSNHILCVRKDWMKEWALSKGKPEDYKPHGITEYTEMFQYFHDSKSTVASDVYGLGLNNNFDFTEGFLSAFGVSPSYTKHADGSYTLSVYEEGYGDFTDWLKNGLTNGYIRSDFYSVPESDSRTEFESGIIGAYVLTENSYGNVCTAFEGRLGIHDAVEWLPFPGADNSELDGSPVGDLYYYGGYCISTTVEEPYRLVKILDYIAGAEGQTLMTWGIKDRHYSVDGDGNKYLTEANITQRYEDNASLFFATDALKPKISNGTYSVGYPFTPAKYRVDGDELVIDRPYKLYLYEGVNAKAYDDYLLELVANNAVNYRQPEFLIADSKVVTNSVACLDYAREYTIQVAAGQDQAKALQTLNERCSAKKINDVYQYLKNHK